MSQSAIQGLFEPNGIALYPAECPSPVWDGIVRQNLTNGAFKGQVWVESAGGAPLAGMDLGVISLPRSDSEAIFAALAAAHCRAVVLLGAAASGGVQRRQERARLRALAKRHRLRAIGPSRIGLLVPERGLAASSIAQLPRSGKLAFLTQSDAIAASVLAWAQEHGFGFSKIVSLGEMADIEFGDLLDYLATDIKTRAILLHLEAVADSRRFLSAARAAARAKPIIVVKGGRYEAVAPAAESHTGILATRDAVYDAAFKRAGLIRVNTIEQLFAAAATLTTAVPLRWRSFRAGRLAIISNGLGPAILAADVLLEGGGALAQFSDSTLAKLRAALPASWIGGNPLDLGAEASAASYHACLDVLSDCPEVDAILAIHCPATGSDATSIAQALAEGYAQRRAANACPLLAAWLVEAAAARQPFIDHQVPCYVLPEQAVRGFLNLVHHQRTQQLLTEIPESSADTAKPQAELTTEVIGRALAAGNAWLDTGDALALLDAYSIPAVPTVLAHGEQETVAAAAELGYPVALKIQSPDIAHRTAVGGVCLNIQSNSELQSRYGELMQRVSYHQPAARIDGVLVQPMYGSQAPELFLGMRDDPQFGPVLLVGQGGVSVEIIRDIGFALPPLNAALARAGLAETRIGRWLLQESTHHPERLQQVLRALIDLSQLVVDRPEVVEIDLNPLILHEHGIRAVDARIRVAPVPEHRAGIERLAIRPYPSELEQTAVLRNGDKVRLRPIRPEDARALQRAFQHVSSEDARMRLFVPVRELSDEAAARFTQIDYDREMCLVILDPDNPDEIWGGARIAANPDGTEAEFAISLRSNLKGLGLGRIALERILDYASARGIKRVWGDVLADNRAMLGLATRLGFSRQRDPDDPELVKVVKTLHTP